MVFLAGESRLGKGQGAFMSIQFGRQPQWHRQVATAMTDTHFGYDGNLVTTEMVQHQGFYFRHGAAIIKGPQHETSQRVQATGQAEMGQHADGAGRSFSELFCDPVAYCLVQGYVRRSKVIRALEISDIGPFH